MVRTNVSDLKNRLSHYLRFVRKGESILVYDREQPIARIEPVGDSIAAEPEAWISELERRGVVRPPETKLPRNWLRSRVNVRADVLGALIEERRTGR
jgi:prevent-host-death family protein